MKKHCSSFRFPMSSLTKKWWAIKFHFGTRRSHASFPWDGPRSHGQKMWRENPNAFLFSPNPNSIPTPTPLPPLAGSESSVCLLVFLIQNIIVFPDSRLAAHPPHPHFQAHWKFVAEKLERERDDLAVRNRDLERKYRKALLMVSSQSRQVSIQRNCCRWEEKTTRNTDNAFDFFSPIRLCTCCCFTDLLRFWMIVSSCSCRCQQKKKIKAILTSMSYSSSEDFFDIAHLSTSTIHTTRDLRIRTWEKAVSTHHLIFPLFSHLDSHWDRRVFCSRIKT